MSKTTTSLGFVRKRNVAYSLIATLVLASYLLPGLLTELLLGVVKLEELTLLLPFVLVQCALVFAIVYFILAKSWKKFGSQPEKSRRISQVAVLSSS